MILRIFLLAVILLTTVVTCSAQDFFRIKAGFSIKERTVDGGSQLTMGTVFYDRTKGQIIYDITFPEKGKMILADSTMTIVRKDSVDKVLPTPILTQFSIFHLALNGDLDNYGFEDSFFKVANVDVNEDQVITTWKPERAYRKALGKVVLSNQRKRLFGAAFFDPDGALLNKQFFRKYEVFQGLDFPTEIVQIAYLEQGEAKKITTYRNVVVNELENDPSYSFPLPE